MRIPLIGYNGTLSKAKSHNMACNINRSPVVFNSRKETGLYNTMEHLT